VKRGDWLWAASVNSLPPCEVKAEGAGLSEERRLAAGRVSHFTSSLRGGELAYERAGGREGGERGRHPQTALGLGVEFFFFFFTKKTELGLKLKQGNTRKKGASSPSRSRSPSFSQFPV